MAHKSFAVIEVEDQIFNLLENWGNASFHINKSSVRRTYFDNVSQPTFDRVYSKWIDSKKEHQGAA